jgi:hypothetical protein
MLSLARKLMYKEISQETLNGDIIDLGGALKADLKKDICSIQINTP